MLGLLRPSVLRSLKQPRAPLFTLHPIKSFSTSPIHQNLVLKTIEDSQRVMIREAEEYDRIWRRPLEFGPENPPYVHLTWDNIHEYKGITELPNGDPIGFDTSAQGLNPEEAYWYGVQGWQDHADHHHLEECGWNINLDGFLRMDERGPHYDVYDPQGRWFFDTPDGGKRYLPK